MPRPTIPAIDRLMGAIAADENGCWIYTGSINRDGYGSISVPPRKLFAHRFAYEHFVGAVPEGLQLDHLCSVRACCNPQHLEAVTALENVHRSRKVKSRTHCPNGHEYTPENNIERKSGGRLCRECSYTRSRVWGVANRDKINAAQRARRAKQSLTRPLPDTTDTPTGIDPDITTTV